MKDSDCRIRKRLSALFASQLVRLDVVLVLVLLRKQKLVELELLAAMLANGNLKIEISKILEKLQIKEFGNY